MFSHISLRWEHDRDRIMPGLTFIQQKKIGVRLHFLCKIIYHMPKKGFGHSKKISFFYGWTKIFSKIFKKNEIRLESTEEIWAIFMLSPYIALHITHVALRFLYIALRFMYIARGPGTFLLHFIDLHVYFKINFVSKTQREYGSAEFWVWRADALKKFVDPKGTKSKGTKSKGT